MTDTERQLVIIWIDEGMQEDPEMRKLFEEYYAEIIHKKDDQKGIRK